MRFCLHRQLIKYNSRKASRDTDAILEKENTLYFDGWQLHCLLLRKLTIFQIVLFFTKKASPKRCYFGKTGNDLGFRLVSKQVCSALVVFTSVFGMRTGVTPLLKSPVMVEWTIVSTFTTTYLYNNVNNL